jgi:hypothetical protein
MRRIRDAFGVYDGCIDEDSGELVLIDKMSRRDVPRIRAE